MAKVLYRQGSSSRELSTRGYNGVASSPPAGGGKVEPKGYGRLPGVVAQLGNQKGDHITERGKTLRGPVLPWVSFPVLPQPVGPSSGMGQGPGANRNLFGPSGTQGKR